MGWKHGDRLRAVAVAVAAATLIGLAAPAEARDETPARPGRKLWGEILVQGGSTDIPLHGVPGMKLGFQLKTWLGADLEPTLTMEAPDGTPVDISGLVKSKLIRNRKKGDRHVLSFKKLLLDQTGTYRVIVHAEPGTSGGFDVKTKGRAPRNAKGEVEIDQPGEVTAIGFEALPGDRVKVVVKGVGKPKWTPIVRTLVYESGDRQPLGLPRKAGPLTMESGGNHVFEVGRDDVGLGTVKYRLKFARPRPPKERADIADLHATARIRGTVRVPGNAPGNTAGPAAKRAERAPRPAPEIRAGEMILAPRAPEPPSALLGRLAETVSGVRFELERSMTTDGPFLIRIPHLAGVRDDRRLQRMTQTIVDAVDAAGWVRYCEPNGVWYPLGEAPSDPRFGEQDGLTAIRAPDAWCLGVTNSDVIVAVVDTGDIAHPDLADRRLASGYDFVSDVSSSDDGDGWDADPTDSSGVFGGVYHGTHVMGIVGAATDNGLGVAGTSPRALLLSVRVLGRFGGSWFDIAAGCRWSAGLSVGGAPPNPRPAQVINMSLGGSAGAQVMADAMTEIAAQTETVIVAAAGNSSSTSPHYPAAYPEVISVSALDQNLVPTTYTNTGFWITLSAPGGDTVATGRGILSTHIDEFGDPNYEELEGTSMACPHVAGVAALMLSADRTLTATRVRTELEATALDLGPSGFDESYGWGLVNAEAAVRRVVPAIPPKPPSLAVVPSILDYGPGTGALFIHVSNSGTGAIDIEEVDATTLDRGGTWLSTSVSATTAPSTITVFVDQANLGEGVFQGAIEIVTDAGTAVVPVRVFRKQEDAISSVSIRLLASDNSVVASTFTNADADWQYELDDVPLGRYRITASLDIDGDLLIDRADEWYTAWPLPASPQWVVLERLTNERADMDMTLKRWGEQIRIEGVGGGAVDGAMAFRVVDDATSQPIAGAEVLVGDGVFRVTTDNAGRAVLVAPLTGEQTVTASADGYAARTHAGMNAQYHLLRLEPAVLTPPTTNVRVTALQLDAAVGDVVFQAGETRTVATHDGSGRVTATLGVPTSRGLVPVFVLGREPDGTPTRYGEGDVVVGGGGTVSVSLTTARPAAPPRLLERVVVLPASFAAASTSVTAAVDLLWRTGDRLPIGSRPFPSDETLGDVLWLAYPGHPLLGQVAAGLTVRASDRTGREAVRLVGGSVDTGFTVASPIRLIEPPLPVAPPDGSTVSRSGLLLEFDPTPGTQLTEVRILDSFDAPFWTLLVAGQSGQLTLPASARGTLRANSVYTWTVESHLVPGMNSNVFRHADVTGKASDRARSGSVLFRTR